MTEGNDQIFNALFRRAEMNERLLGPAEIMAAIGLTRTSIYSTYADIHLRMLAHNASLQADPDEQEPATRSRSSSIAPRETHKQLVARLRRERKTEWTRAQDYAEQIRRLTLENWQLKHADPNVVDARRRFALPDDTQQ